MRPSELRSTVAATVVAIASAAALPHCGGRASDVSETRATGAPEGGAGGGVGSKGGVGPGGSGGVGVGGGELGGASGANAGGAGGNGNGAMAAAGTGGAAGNEPGACVSLTQVGDIATVEQAAGFSDLAPALTLASVDGASVAIALVRQPEGDVTTNRFEHATLKPWSAWPAGGLVGPTTLDAFADPGLPPAYLVAPADADDFALLWYPTYVGLPNPGYATPQLEIVGSNPSAGTTALPYGAPMLLARGVGAYLVGTSGPPSPGVWSIFAKRVPMSPSMPVTPLDTPLGCAAAPIVAAVVPHGSGWLVALSNAAAAPNLGCGGSVPGPPTRIDVVLVGADGKTSFVQGTDAGAPVSEISMAPHPSGAFVVWRVASGGAVAPLRWMRVDVSGAGLVGPGDVAAPELAPLGGFATAALGTRLVVAWGSDPANHPPDLVLSVIGETGSVVAMGGIPQRFVPPLSLVAAPDGKGIVVAWHEPTSVGGPTAVRLGRFDCAGGI